MRLAGRATGRQLTVWTLGKFAESTGDGALAVTMPSGEAAAGRGLPAEAAADARARADELGPFSPHIALAPVPVTARLAYEFDGTEIRFAPSEFATRDTFVAFDGRTAWGQASRLPFHVTSSNWQESHRFLAGIISMVSTPTAAVPIDGIGQFDGVMLGALANPRVEGTFAGKEMRAWNVTWGDIEGEAVIENSYADVKRVVVREDLGRMDIEGKFSLGYPRRDGGEEIDARIRATEWPLPGLRAAFKLYDYPVFGALGGEIHLYGKYEEPFGFGRVTLDRGTAYDEPFAAGVTSLRFEGAGVRLDGLEVQKAGTLITGAAYIGWDGTYSFNADGRHLAVDALDLTYFPTLPAITGFADFSAAGSGTFEEPRYDVKVSVFDLFIGEEGLGQMTAQVALRGLTVLYSFDLASPRLAASGSGQFGLTDAGEIEMTVRLSDASLDPFARVFQPALSPYTSATGSGTVRVWGEVYTANALHVTSSVDDLRVRLFDYELRNRGVIRVGLDGQVVTLDAFTLAGDRTALEVTGQVDLERDVITMRASGEANLAVIQGVLPQLRGSGRAQVAAAIGGSMATPTLSGAAVVSDGRLRSFAFPHALEEINGVVAFDASAIRLDGLRARLAGGQVQVGGRIGVRGFALTDYDVTLTGTDLGLRYPEGLRSLVDATLAVQGPAATPVLSGTVTVRSAVWTPAFTGSTSVFGSSSTADVTPGPSVAGAVATPSSTALHYDVRLLAPSTLRIENDLARIVASADLNLRGTFDRPVVFGRADIERGEVRFEGRRYLVSRGSLDFTNPERIQPFFDVEAETRVRVPAQTYRVTLRIAGTTERLQPEFTSDPPLPPADVLSLLLSDTTPAGDVEVASLRSPNQREQDLLQARATRALTGALSAEVGRVVQDTFGVDSFQITPLLTDPYQQAVGLSLNPGARVTIGKRLSDRVYLTYARSLSSSTRYEIILLEYRSDRHARLAVVAERRRHVRARSSQASHVLMAVRMLPGAPRTRVCDDISVGRGRRGARRRGRRRRAGRAASHRRASPGGRRAGHGTCRARLGGDHGRGIVVDDRRAPDHRSPRGHRPFRGYSGVRRTRRRRRRTDSVRDRAGRPHRAGASRWRAQIAGETASRRTRGALWQRTGGRAPRRDGGRADRVIPPSRLLDGARGRRAGTRGSPGTGVGAGDRYARSAHRGRSRCRRRRRAPARRCPGTPRSEPGASARPGRARRAGPGL